MQDSTRQDAENTNSTQQVIIIYMLITSSCTELVYQWWEMLEYLVLRIQGIPEGWLKNWYEIDTAACFLLTHLGYGEDVE